MWTALDGQDVSGGPPFHLRVAPPVPACRSHLFTFVSHGDEVDRDDVDCWLADHPAFATHSMLYHDDQTGTYWFEHNVGDQLRSLGSIGPLSVRGRRRVPRGLSPAGVLQPRAVRAPREGPSGARRPREKGDRRVHERRADRDGDVLSDAVRLPVGRSALAASAITPNPASRGRLKSGHFGPSGTGCEVIYFAAEDLGKFAA